MWAVDVGGQLLYYDGSSWQVELGGTLALDSVYGLPGQTTIFLVGAGSQYYQVQGVNVVDFSQGDGVENLTVWAASANQVWIGSNGLGRPLAAYNGKDWTTYGPAGGHTDPRGARGLGAKLAQALAHLGGRGGGAHLYLLRDRLAGDVFVGVSLRQG
jgi:hypothetical protein